MSLYVLNHTQISRNITESLPGHVSHFYQTYQNPRTSKKETPRYACCSAVFTLEAAVILPLAACFLVSILYFFRIMQVQMEVQDALDDTACRLAVYEAGAEGREIVSLALAMFMLGNELEESSVVQSYVAGGTSGISLITSDVEGTDICLNAVYKIRFPIMLLGELRMKVKQSANCRKWSGWPGVDSETGKEIWVYIAKNGSVYHMVRNCTYIQLSVEGVARADALKRRNQSGVRYRECRSCRKKKKGEWVYITNQGECYHYDRNCSGIKRTVFKIRFSDSLGRQQCSKCGDKSAS